MNCDLAEKLAETYDVIVLTPTPSRPIGFAFSSLKKVGRYKQIVLDSYTHPKSEMMGRLKESYSFGKKTVEYIKTHHDEIDFVYNDGWQFVGLYLVAKACVKFRIPYIVPIQDIYPESVLTKLPQNAVIQSVVKALLSPIDRYYIRHAAKVRTISNGMARYLSDTRHVAFDAFLVVANWQNEDGFEEYYPKEDDGKLRFMFAGNNSRQANVDLIINAFIDARLENAELHVMGGGNAKEYCQQLAKERGGNNVFFNPIPEGKVPEAQSKGDIMVLALKAGTGKLGIPSKMVAYMLSGKPVIASVETDSDTAEIIKKGDCGYVVSPDNRQQLASAFSYYSNMNKSRIDEQGRNSLLYARKELSKNSNLMKVVNSIENIIDK